MDSGTVEWWRRHGWTIALLLAAFGIAFAVRTIWTYPVVERWGALYTYAGGSDSYYHSRVMTYIIQTHRNLIHDPMLKFPIGAINPREPLFDWMNAILGLLFAPFFGGNANNAGAWFLDLQAPLWAALEVFPIYLIGREISGRRNGLIAAMVFPFFSASIDTSTFGYADYQSFYTFFLLVCIYAYLRTIKAIGHRRYVESYGSPRQIVNGIRAYFRTERTAVKWSVFAGVSMGALALSWQGYTYAIVVVVFTLIIAMLIERIRRVDSFGLYVSTWIIGIVGVGMSAPYYIVQHELRVFLELPVILLFGALLVLLPFLLLRDVPWVFSVPALIAVVGAGVLALKLFTPTLFTAAITGDGYFVKNLIYSTVAEAQAPSFDALVVGYGIVTFFLAFVGIALFAYLLIHQRFKRYHIAFLVFGVVSVYLPISASKFFLVGAPAFALLSAEAVHRLLDIGGYPQLRRAVASLSDRTGSVAAFGKSFKARHVLVLALAVGVILPNVWVSIDAGIPSNTKDQFAVQINKTIPSWLKLNKTSPASDYLGAAGSGLDTPNEYDSAAYNWLATQDTGLPEPARPAYVSWWDYGFQAIDQGQHPSVADNFQNGIDPAGQFLLAQNESLAIAVLAATLLQGEIQLTHNPHLPDALNAILAGDGVNLTILHRALDDEAADYQTVIHHPHLYLPVNPSTITDDNAMYLVTSYYLADHLSESGVARVYDSLEQYTGWSIRYAMTDSRLFPFSGSDTGIFYAPADLTGRVVNAEGVPTSFFNVSILGSDGTTYPLGTLPAGVSAEQYNINYSSPFYRTMLYRIYIGYNGTEVGQKSGIPGLTGAAESDPIRPGWMLQHFEVEYETAYVCPGVKDAKPSASCFRATNRPNAIHLANVTNGTDNLTAFDYFQGGESILTYYAGVTLNGHVVTTSGQPVSGVRVTVYDGWGIPHMTSLTNSQGDFSLILPPGNDTLNITSGPLNKMNQSGSHLIESIKEPVSAAEGYSPSAPTLVQTFPVASASVNGLVFWNVTGNKTYSTAEPVVIGANVSLSAAASAKPLTARTDPSGSFVLSDVAPGAYNVSVKVGNVTYAEGSKTINPGGTTNLSLGLSPGKISGTVSTPSGGGSSGATVTIRNATALFATAIANDTGGFTVSSVPPGRYIVSATGSIPGSTSNRVTVTLATAGATATANLVVQLRGTSEVGVQGGGGTIANATVTWLPQIAFSGSTSSGIEPFSTATTNTTYAKSDADGVATASVPLGSYTVQATGVVGGVLYTGLGTVNVTASGSTTAVLLNLTPAHTVTVSVTGGKSGNKTALLAYGRQGTEAAAWGATDGTTMLTLPSGTYTFLALSSSGNDLGDISAALEAKNVSSATALALHVGPTVAVHLSVGTPASSGEVLGAAGAHVVVSVGSDGPALSATADSNGTVGFYVPTTAAGGAGGYCLRASAFGFQSNQTCDLTAQQLGKLSTLGLQVNDVAVSLVVEGLPAKTNVSVNITGETTGARSVHLKGGPKFSLELPPGTYGIGARAVIGHGTTVYLPATTLSTVIPVGATSSNLTLVVLAEINASGKLSLPSGVSAGSVQIALTSPLMNVTVNGTAYTKAFRATPANYTATVTAEVAGEEWVNVTRITIPATGTITPKLVLSEAGVTVNTTLTQSNGKAVPLSTSVTFVNSKGLSIAGTATDGVVSALLPPGSYRVHANGTASTAGPNGTYYTDWSSAANATCTFSSGSTHCLVPMTGVTETVAVHGALIPAGSTTPTAGAVRLVGPYPATTLQVISAPNGTFSVALQPGEYNIYATTTSGVSAAAFGRFLALPSTSDLVEMLLRPAWTTTVHVAAANATGGQTGPGTFTFRNAFGAIAQFTGVNPGSSFSLLLPAGNYTLKATGNGSRNSIAGVATAAQKFTVASGNAVVTASLQVPVAATVAAAIGGSSSASVAAGGTVTFPFTLRASGNVPVTVRPVGSPSSWTFTFHFPSINFSSGRLTLTPGASIAGEVSITVPPGTAVAHAPVAISFDLASGVSAGSVAPAPTITVLGFYGLKSGTVASAPPRVGPVSAVLPFFLTNRGNTNETVRLTVSDAARLAELDWTTSWLVNNKSSTTSLVSLTAGENESVSLVLNSTGAGAIAPGTVSVQATVTNPGAGISQAITLKVPHPTVATSPGSLGVTGVRVQSGPSGVPSWVVPILVFVPALLLIGLVVSYRWWRTRRWTRR